MEGLEKEIKLGLEAIEICEEILKYIGEQDRMIIEKAKVYSEIFLRYKVELKLQN